MMLYHDGLRITLPKMPATAQFLGQPLLISLFDWYPSLVLTPFNPLGCLMANGFVRASSKCPRFFNVSLRSSRFFFQCISFLRDETLSNNYQLEAVSELCGFDFKPLFPDCPILLISFILMLTSFACRFLLGYGLESLWSLHARAPESYRGH